MRIKNDLIKMLIVLYILIIACRALLSQNSTPDNMGLKQFTIEDKELGTIDFYTDKENLNKKLPVILDVQGSGGFPFIINFQHPDDTFEICLIQKYLLEHSKYKYHYVIISKPGTPFSDNIKTTSRNYMQLLEDYQPTEEYTRRLDLEWRTMASSKVINYLCENIKVDESKIAVWGYSEGGNVVPEIARVNKKVTHVVSIGGAGLNHFYDDIINNRLKAERGEISHEKAQKNIDSLYIVFNDIYKNPESTKYWRSNSYKRWASFSKTIALESLTKLDIPIYMVVGTKDYTSPILGLDYVKLEFMRLGKTNLTYDVMVNCNHAMMETTVIDGKNKYISHLDEIYDRILKWLGVN